MEKDDWQKEVEKSKEKLDATFLIVLRKDGRISVGGKGVTPMNFYFDIMSSILRALADFDANIRGEIESYMKKKDKEDKVRRSVM